MKVILNKFARILKITTPPPTRADMLEMPRICLDNYGEKIEIKGKQVNPHSTSTPHPTLPLPPPNHLGVQTGRQVLHSPLKIPKEPGKSSVEKSV